MGEVGVERIREEMMLSNKMEETRGRMSVTKDYNEIQTT